MDPVTLGGVACIAIVTLFVGLSAVWWMIKSAVKLVYKLVVFAVITVLTVGAIGAVAAALTLR